MVCLQCRGRSRSLPLGTGTAAALAFLSANGSPRTLPRCRRAPRTVMAWLCEDKSHIRDEHSHKGVEERVEGGVSTRQMFIFGPVNPFFVLFFNQPAVDLVVCLIKDLLFFVLFCFCLWAVVAVFDLYADYLSDTVRRCGPRAEGQDDLPLPDRRSPRRIFQKALRGPWRCSSSRANTAGNSPGGENQRVKGQLWFHCVWLPTTLKHNSRLMLLVIFFNLIMEYCVSLWQNW